MKLNTGKTLMRTLSLMVFLMAFWLGFTACEKEPPTPITNVQVNVYDSTAVNNTTITDIVIIDSSGNVFTPCCTDGSGLPSCALPLVGTWHLDTVVSIRYQVNIYNTWTETPFSWTDGILNIYDNGNADFTGGTFGTLDHNWMINEDCQSILFDGWGGRLISLTDSSMIFYLDYTEPTNIWRLRNWHYLTRM